MKKGFNKQWAEVINKGNSGTTRKEKAKLVENWQDELERVTGQKFSPRKAISKFLKYIFLVIILKMSRNLIGTSITVIAHFFIYITVG